VIFWLASASHPHEDTGRNRELERQEDEMLVELARDWPDTTRGRQAAAILLKRYRANVYRWCRQVLRDEELALDISQEVLISAYGNLASFGGRARFSSWLFAITRNRCLSQLRRPRLLIGADEILDLVPSPITGPAREMELADEEDELRRLLGDFLNPREQEAIWLRCIEGYSVDEITEMLGIEGATGARSMLQNARRKLRRRWPRADGGKGRES